MHFFIQYTFKLTLEVVLANWGMRVANRFMSDRFERRANHLNPTTYNDAQCN